ncbi:hypothetical protein H9659_09850 [Sporosarcina sp. Sa3CUA8]|uniref:Transposase InsH N-terminal domain-containing protein n=1 Tax=Sporosarcina gallistercoris TaxID=2762245 RepID=A0ABR8PKF6_9BACL|nr:hypothetical protein [Sporosarcina gallistercoris]
MTKNQVNEREQMEMLTIEQLVPQDHLVRKLDAAIDFSFIYPLVEDLYSLFGRPSIDPVVLIKMTFMKSKKYTENAKRRLNKSLPTPRRSMVCDGQP